VLDAIAQSADPVGALRDLAAPPRAGADWASFVEMVGDIHDATWPADLELARVWYVHISNASMRTRKFVALI